MSAVDYQRPTPGETARVRAAIEAYKAECNARDAALADRIDALAANAHAIAGELRGRALSATTT